MKTFLILTALLGAATVSANVLERQVLREFSGREAKELYKTLKFERKGQDVLGRTLFTERYEHVMVSSRKDPAYPEYYDCYLIEENVTSCVELKKVTCILARQLRSYCEDHR